MLSRAVYRRLCARNATARTCPRFTAVSAFLTDSRDTGPQPLRAAVPALEGNTIRRIALGCVFLRNRTQDWLVVLEVTVDPTAPPLEASPGTVTESDERNNFMRYRCVVRGSNPDSTYSAAPSCSVLRNGGMIESPLRTNILVSSGTKSVRSSSANHARAMR